MPAKRFHRVTEEGTYSHIYNKGIEKKIIFNDSQDHETFQGFLKDYLTPAPAESAKKTFTVNGRVFRGVPHQPKNYFNKVELIAYSLMPDHFHLVLLQKAKGSQERFLRSLSTRYSMYFNKKYNRTGSLFDGPYKSLQIKDLLHLLLLTRYLHDHQENGKDGYSSYKEFIGERETDWVKPDAALSYFDKAKNNSFKDTANYRDFIDKHELTKSEQEILEGIILERILPTDKPEPLEGRIPALERKERKVAQVQPAVRESKASSDIVPVDDVPALPSLPELAIATAVFLLLFAFGIRNINASFISSPKSSVSGVTTESAPKEETKSLAKPDPALQDKKVLIVRTDDPAASINIRREPTVQSEKIGVAYSGETFEFIPVNSEWYEIKLTNEARGFISAKFVEVVEGQNQ